jgi:pimeloyl-ACP methyl ester carboxylesterase
MVTPAATRNVRTWLRLPGMLCTDSIFRAMDQYLFHGSAMVDVEVDGDNLTQASDAVLAEATRHPGPVGIMGLSLGAIVAMAACVKAPAAFAAAILISTNPRAPRPGQVRTWEDLAARNSQGGLPRIAAESAPSLYAPSLSVKAHHSKRLLRAAEEMALAVGPQRFARQLAIQNSRIDLRPALASLYIPTLVLAGAEDQLCGPEVHVDIATHLRDAELHVFPDLGHLLPLEAPALAASCINTWIQRRNL